MLQNRSRQIPGATEYYVGLFLLLQRGAGRSAVGPGEAPSSCLRSSSCPVSLAYPLVPSLGWGITNTRVTGYRHTRYRSRPIVRRGRHVMRYLTPSRRGDGLRVFTGGHTTPPTVTATGALAMPSRRPPAHRARSHLPGASTIALAEAATRTLWQGMAAQASRAAAGERPQRRRPQPPVEHPNTPRSPMRAFITRSLRRSLHGSGRSAPSRDEPLTARLVGRRGRERRGATRARSKLISPHQSTVCPSVATAYITGPITTGSPRRALRPGAIAGCSTRGGYAAGVS